MHPSSRYPASSFSYYLLDTTDFEPNPFTSLIPGVNDTAMLTATGPDCGLPTIGAVRVVLEPKPGLPTDPNDVRALFFPIAAASGAQLTLASHTHGGQVSLFGRPLIKAYDYVHGPFENGGASLDVSAGAGDWLPVRIFTPREVVIITLRQG